MKDRAEYMKEYRKRNQETINARDRERYHASADLRDKKKEASKRYYLSHKEQRITYKATRKGQISERTRKKLGGIKL